MHRIGTSLFFAPLALVAATAGLPAHADPASSQPRTITVSGEGEVKAAPDEAILTAGVETQAPTANAALAANRRAMNEVFAELKRQGIPDKSIQTSEFNVSPQFDSPKHGASKIIAYQVSNNVSVTVDDLSKLGPAIDALVASGSNSLGGISFTIRDPKPLLKDARAAAVKDAMDRADTYARVAGVSVGPVTQINETGMQVPRPMMAGRMMMAGLANATPVAAGEESISAQVSITFEIR